MTVGQVAQAGNQQSIAQALYKEVMRETYLQVSKNKNLTAKYQAWFMDGKVLDISNPNDEFQRELARVFMINMKKRLEAIGDKQYNAFHQKISQMPHQLRKSVQALMIPGSMSHGSCRFAQVVKECSNSLETARFFVTNAQVDVDTKRGDKFLKIVGKDVKKSMYYGLAQTFDKEGNFKGMNRDIGDSGILFITDDKIEALFQIASISTGKDISALRSMVSSPKH